jgi:hypothetical protein
MAAGCPHMVYFGVLVILALDAFSRALSLAVNSWAGTEQGERTCVPPRPDEHKSGGSGCWKCAGSVLEVPWNGDKMR